MIELTSSDHLGELAEWSNWLALADALVAAPRQPGVYLARESNTGVLVYVGMAGERRGQGIRGRLRVYTSGKALASGLGEAVMDRALSDEAWIAARLDDLRAGQPARAKQWGQLAFERADLEVCWATAADRDEAIALERACLDALHNELLWNRRRRQRSDPDPGRVPDIDEGASAVGPRRLLGSTSYRALAARSWRAPTAVALLSVTAREKCEAMARTRALAAVRPSAAAYGSPV